MQRYLLFDSGCSICTDIAASIEEESNGWLEARSLRDPAMKVLLDRAKPSWQWEPALLEVDQEAIRIFTGLKLRMKIAVGLGLRRSWRIALLVQQANLSQEERKQFFSSPRRRFLAGMGAVVGTTILSAPHVSAQSSIQQNLVRELDGLDADTFISLAQKSPTLTAFQQQLQRDLGATFTLRMDKATAIEVGTPNADKTVVVRFAIDGGTEDSVFSIIYDKMSLTETNHVYAVYQILDNKNIMAYTRNGHQNEALNIVIDNNGQLIRVTTQNGKDITPTEQVNSFFDCFSCCFSAAGVSQAVIVVASIACGILCSTGPGCIACLAGLALFSSSILNFCGSQCIVQRIDCCSTRCVF